MVELLEPVQQGALEQSEIGRYLRWLEAERGMKFSDYDSLWQWSVDSVEDFWCSVWDYFEVNSDTPITRVLSSREMPGARWFEGATVNLAEHALSHEGMDDRVVVTAVGQSRAEVQLTYAELKEQVRRVRAAFEARGVVAGDRVAAYLPNIPETLVAYLATLSLGAVWASCAPEFGASGVLDRFGQIEPTVLLVVDGYVFGEKRMDRSAEVAKLVEGLPSAKHVIHVPYLDPLSELDGAITWEELLQEASEDEPLTFNRVPFEHPASVLFTSGTTGRPKAIVHGQGGLLIEHLKNHAFHWDLGDGDTLLWFTTTAWMMWNALASTLLVRAGIVMIDGSPAYPDTSAQWALAERTGATTMGISAGLLMQCHREEIHPGRDFDLSKLRQLGSVGSPLPIEGYEYVHREFGNRLLLNVGSGGTDVCTGIVHGSPIQPVWLGEMSGRGLGIDAHAFNEQGVEVIGELGELVITTPMPSMPVGFWGDDGTKYHEAYFDMYPGVWRHGDWIRFSEAGSCVITGRSDATLNRGGVRLGTAEFYRIVESIPEIVDSLVVHLEGVEDDLGALWLFVVMAPGRELDDALTSRISSLIRSELSPRHTPDRIEAVPTLPRTRTGKKLEVPIKRILMGEPLMKVVDPDAVDDADALLVFGTLQMQT